MYFLYWPNGAEKVTLNDTGANMSEILSDIIMDNTLDMFTNYRFLFVTQGTLYD